jgi:hypothetical protein
MFGVVANVASDRVLRTGAKVWIERCNGDAECPVVRGCSKSGRVVEKYTHYKRLTNFRAAWIPEHLRERVIWQWPEKERAQHVAATLASMWDGVRYFNRDGSEVKKDGITTSEAFRRVLRGEA